MELFSYKKVFNKDLIGKAVHLKGKTKAGRYYDRVFLVHDVKNNGITLLSHIGAYYEFFREDFEHDDNPLKIFIMVRTY